MPLPTASVPFYHQHARHLADLYDSLPFEQLHQGWLAQISQPGLALDVGAAAGRDSRWLASAGWQVVAVEPAAAMRELGIHTLQAQTNIREQVEWLDDSLPHLALVPERSYDLILVSAVWMHLSMAHRPAALRRLAGLLAADGLLVITLKNSAQDPRRPSYPVSAMEVRAMARPLKLMVEELPPSEDLLQRHAVRWQTLLLRRQS